MIDYRMDADCDECEAEIESGDYVVCKTCYNKLRDENHKLASEIIVLKDEVSKLEAKIPENPNYLYCKNWVVAMLNEDDTTLSVAKHWMNEAGIKYLKVDNTFGINEITLDVSKNI